MARSFVYSVTADGGLVERVALDTLAADDLPRPSPGAAGGHNADYLVVDQYGRVVSSSASTAAYTDAANTFALGQTISAPDGTVGLTVNGHGDDSAESYVKFARPGFNSWVTFANDLRNFRSLSVGMDAGANPGFANTIYLGGSNASVQMYDAAGSALKGLFGVAASAGQLFTGSTAGDLVFRSEFGGVWFSQGASTPLLRSGVGDGLRSYMTSALTSTAADNLQLRHRTVGTAAAGFGSNLRFQLQSSTTVDQDAAAATATWTDATHATRTGRLSLGAYYTSTFQEGLRIDAASDAARVGVGGAAASGQTLTVTGAADADVVLEVVGHSSSQSGRLQEWSKSGGDIKAWVTSGGVVTGTSFSTQPDGGFTALDDGSANFGLGASGVDALGGFRPAQLADATANNDTVYYSTDAGKLVYKDSGGTVHALY